MSFVRLHAPVLDVLDRLQAQSSIRSLHSHEETGVAWTFDRDKAVSEWCKRHQVPWMEEPQLGVQRGRTDRRGWVNAWHVNMARPLAHPGLKALQRLPQSHPPAWRWPEGWTCASPPVVTHADDLAGTGPFQPGGERVGHKSVSYTHLTLPTILLV